MSSRITALARTETKRRGLGWLDQRGISPKAAGDFSGIILSKIGAQGVTAIQNFDYEALSKLYVCNDLVWTCINLVSSTVAQGKLKVRKVDKNGGITYLPDHPLQKILDNSNASMTQFDLIQAYVTHQMLFGNVTLLLLRESMVPICDECIKLGIDDCAHKFWYGTEGPIEQIMPIHPENIHQELIKDPETGIKKMFFFYVPNGLSGTKYLIHPNNILTDPYYNPDVGWYGVSPTFLLKRWITLDHAMTGQITELFENGAIPSMLINVKPGSNFTYEQNPDDLMKFLKEKWMAQFSSRGEARKTPAFVYGDVNVEKLQQEIDDALSKGLYYEIQSRVCATYGVPPTLYEMGLKMGGQKAGAEQGEKDFFNRTISKILIRIQLKINQLIVPSYGDPELEVAWDLKDMGIAAFLLKAKEASIRLDWELGLIQRDLARLLLGYEPMGGELGNDLYRTTVMSDGQGSSSQGKLSQGQDNRQKIPKDSGGAHQVVTTMDK